MKRFLAFAVVLALLAMPMVLGDFQKTITGMPGSDVCSPACPPDRPTCVDGECVPEFTTLGAGIAIAGAGIAYWFIRSRKK